MDLDSLDIPPVLTNMMHHLLTTYGHIKSWNIYENVKGTINVNIRFDNIVCGAVGHSEHASCVEPAMYRRLSSKQMERNRMRAASWSTHATDVKKRRMDVISPEIIRKDTDVTYTKYVDTPEKIYVDYEHTSPLRRSTTYSDCEHPTMTPEALIHHGPQPVLHMDEMQVVTELVPCHMAYTLEPIIVPPIDYGTSPLITATVSHEPHDEYVYQDHITHSYTSASLIQIPNETDNALHDITENEEPEPSPSEVPIHHTAQSSSHDSRLVRCPCCDDPMTVGHMCDLEGDNDQNSKAYSVSSSLVQSSPPSLPPPKAPDPWSPDPNVVAAYIKEYNQKMDQIFAEFSRPEKKR